MQFVFQGDAGQISEMTPMAASSEIEGLPDNIFTEEVILSSGKKER